MGLLAWFTRNWADTDEDRDPALAPPLLPVPPSEALTRLQAAIRSLPHWRIESVDQAAGKVDAIRQTRLLRFVDDIHVYLEPVDGMTRVHARSQSRVGKGDFGQNRRNLLELFRALRS
jgi:uncharacterized protein (DUF1499 family)